MKRATSALLLALAIQRLCDLDRVRIYFDHAVEGGPAFVDGLDAAEILFRNRARRKFTRPHAFLQIVDRDFIEFERGDIGY